ncbi:MAG: type II toxin-antitoxin system RnlB family antitoxin [Peptoniphilus harei]|uniref:type II toxin-antitoxin system RnlB family antitoxin n=1 Tax=Peptoniphilaceae TaxID=1570339 RepID=UPI0008DADA17|nr:MULTISPECIES: type II toxin-antitoxin system RnlB family antitoxin [Peptoniphilaceae]MBS6611233.1 type II toxin-antitoxin system RnlB family antitoxin [Peptoniphilus harei]
MEKYLINDLNISGYKKIITLLDYKEKISTCLKNIKLLPSSEYKVLIDTALVSGINSYRFLEVKINKDGTINLNKYSYPIVDENIINKANSIISKESIWLKNSILTNSQKELIATF